MRAKRHQRHPAATRSLPAWPPMDKWWRITWRRSRPIIREVCSTRAFYSTEHVQLKQFIFAISLTINCILLLEAKPSETQAPYRVSSAGPHPRPFQEATRAQKPPLPISGETVSKRVLSAQPRYQPIRVDDIMAKAGTLTWVTESVLSLF